MKSRAVFSVIGLAAAALAPAAAQAQSGCTAHVAESDAINPDVNAAFALIEAKKIAEGIAMLPKLEALFEDVPAKMPAPEQCGADVLVYDDHQLAEFQALQAAGKRVPGYAADTNFVKKEIPFVWLSYAVGWLNYEKGDFAKARALYEKGLVIAPNQHDLVNEMLATLINLKAYPELIAFTDRFLASDKDSDAEMRSKALTSKAIGQFYLKDTAGALVSVDAALQLWPENSDAAAIKAALLGTS